MFKVLRLGLLSVFLMSLMGCALPWDWITKQGSLLGEREEKAVAKAIPTTLTGRTMGTTYTVKYFGGWNETPRNIHREIDERLLAFNQVFSTYDPSSEVTALNQKLAQHSQGESLTLQISESMVEQLSVAVELSFLTRGYFDVTIAPLVGLWGFGANAKDSTQGRTQRIPSPNKIARSLKLVGYEKILLDHVNRTVFMAGGMALDFSAIAKGRGVDRLGEYLETLGVNNYLVEIGGELRSSGIKPIRENLLRKDIQQHRENLFWTLSIVSPHENTSVLADEVEKMVKIILPQEKRGIATSGNYHNYVIHEGVRYPHIINPRSGLPVQHGLASVTVIAETCERADALATAFMAMGGEEALSLAEKNDLAVFFVEEKDEKWVTYYSPAFESYLVNK